MSDFGGGGPLPVPIDIDFGAAFAGENIIRNTAFVSNWTLNKKTTFLSGNLFGFIYSNIIIIIIYTKSLWYHYTTLMENLQLPNTACLS